MAELEGIYWIWYREIKRFLRARSRVITSFVQPLFLLIVFGGGFGFLKFGGVNYQTFLFPGIVAMALLFVSVSSGISVIWDREFGFLKEILVAPVSRLSIFFGKALGGVSTALIQGLIILSLSFILGIQLTPLSFLVSVVIMTLISLSMVSVGLLIASFLESMESFGLIMNFLIFPLYFLSGAMFPLDQAPYWLKAISIFDPLTYGVDALRASLLGISAFNFFLDFLVLSAFSAVMLFVGSIAFSRQKG